jgi:hypothetical protein
MRVRYQGTPCEQCACLFKSSWSWSVEQLTTPSIPFTQSFLYLFQYSHSFYSCTVRVELLPSFHIDMLPLAVLLCLGLVSLGQAGYVLQDDYSTNNFFSMFDFFTVR